MLKSTYQPLSREQFTKLREARRLVKQELGAELILQSESVIHDLYKFAVQSSAGTLFDLFEQLHDLSDASIQHRLNKQQFLMLREARELIKSEFESDFDLSSAQVFNDLHQFGLQSRSEDLHDIFTYLTTRSDAQDQLPGIGGEVVSGERFIKLRAVRQMIEEQFNERVSIESDAIMDTLYQYALRAEEGELFDTVDYLRRFNTDTQSGSEIIFASLSADSFDQLREAKRQIEAEFDAGFSLHSGTALDDLYRFALRSESEALFDLFTELKETQSLGKRQKQDKRRWMSKEQFTLYRSARADVRSEFDQLLDLASVSVNDELYQFALRSEHEQLFDICSQLNAVRPREGTAFGLESNNGLLSKEHFLKLRSARSLIQAEFSEELNLQSDVVHAELYKYAVRSESDDLFDLHMSLMDLAQSQEALCDTLTKDEFVVLRVARRLVKTEFDADLALDAADVLDRLYEYSLESEGEELFDLHAQLISKVQDASSAAESEQVDASITETAEAETKKPMRKIATFFSRSKTTAPADDGVYIPEAVKNGKTQDILRSPAVEDSKILSEILVENGFTAQPDAEEQSNEAASVQTESVPNGIAKSAPKPPQPGATSGARHRSGGIIDRAIIKQAETQSRAAASDQKASAGAPDGNAVPTVYDMVEQDCQVNKAAKEPQRASTAVKKKKQVRQKKSAKRRKGSRTGGALTNEATQAEPAAANKYWHVASVDGRSDVRVLDKLNIGVVGGEPIIGSMDADTRCAVINVVKNRPVLGVTSDAIEVNGERVKGAVELGSGDKIKIGDSVLQVRLV